nr:putative cyanate transporter [Klebsiella pneumoniae]
MGAPALLALLSWLAICRQLPRAPHQTSASPGRDYWPAPRPDAGTLFRTDQCRLRQPDRRLPPYFIQLGDSAQYSGSLLALLTVGQTAGAAAPGAGSPEDRRQLLLLALALQLIGFCGFIWLPEHFSALWAIACGVGLGGAFPLCPVLALDHAGQPAVAGRLVAFMQGIGFIIAGLSPGFPACCVA